jgi:hypothetical protein
MGEIYQIAAKLPNGHKAYQITVAYYKWPQNIPTFSILRPFKIYGIGIFGLKINHLATLLAKSDLS